MNNLLLTLGHNSSAILVRDSRVVCGYEEERLTGVKSDSRFPVNAIERVLQHDGQPLDMVYCTHWEPFAQVSRLGGKYWQPEMFDGVPIRSHTDNTHHDTHAHAAVAFAGHDFPRVNTGVLVVDGFGSFGEHLSYYSLDNSGLTLQCRFRGYNSSLGLMYQYATAFMGLKMHEDEYKLLGYEVHVNPQHVDVIKQMAADHLDAWLLQTDVPVLGSVYDPVYNLAALAATREHYFERFQAVLKVLDLHEPTHYEARTALAYYVQLVLEQCILSVLKRFGPTNLIVSGGCFYNVKLNNVILGDLPGIMCAYPLAGDQGNALGLYAMDHPYFTFPDTLAWGHRKLYQTGQIDGMHFLNEQDALDLASRRLAAVGYVNLVRGWMEFGPRALCNTSTLALPTAENVRRINAANNRNTVMPMAPVMLRSQYSELFYDTEKVWKSERYMIMAMEYANEPQGMEGAAHKYSRPWIEHWTGRPQVIEDSADDIMVHLLKSYGPLINTSFNYHGQPIAFEMAAVIDTHRAQRLVDSSFETIVVVN